MKNFFKTGLCLMIIALISSCQTEEECYSCNESVDNWARQNIESISKMDRADIIQLPAEKQRAAFRVLSPERKTSVWLDKISYLKNKYKSDEEIKLFEFVENVLANRKFDKEMSDKEYYAVEAKLLPLVEAAGWSKSKMVYAFGTLQNEKQVNNDFYGSSSKVAVAHDVDCNCNWGWCGDGGDCEKETCDETDFGCGFLGFGSCDEICSGHGHDKLNISGSNK
ncbi:bacteriocin fulvocin C-related protein [Bizionia sediminis]|uniref:Bacteriocin fulvocin C-related protein n=1 Tax=Bizionia sediminis TaxID=1737064 RepID=A0ABW5KU74_9FLAO